MEEKGLVERGTDLDRIVNFSDAIFAFAITLLVLEIRVPDGLSPRELTDMLVDMWPDYLSYLISFTLIGSFWRSHRLIFRYIRAYNRRLSTLNSLLLMWVAFLPFPVSLFGSTRNSVSRS